MKRQSEARVVAPEFSASHLLPPENVSVKRDQLAVVATKRFTVVTLRGESDKSIACR